METRIIPLLLSFFIGGCDRYDNAPDAAALQWGDPYTIGADARKLLVDKPLDRMSTAGHQTSWWVGGWNDSNGSTDNGRYFIFITFDKRTADAVESALRRDHLLCDQPLDDVLSIQ